MGRPYRINVGGQLRARPKGPGRLLLLGAATLIGLGQGIAFHAGSVGLTFLLVVAVDPHAGVVPVLAAMAVARLTLVVPVTPSGLGIHEGALAILFASLGMSPDTGLAAMLLARASLVITTVIGAVLLIHARPSLPRPDASVVA